MSMKKRIGTCAAALAAVGALGATVYGIGNMDSSQTENRITLDSPADLKEETTLDTATAEAAEIDEIPTQDSSDSSYGLPNVQKVAETAMPAIVAITNQGIEEVNFFGRSYQQETTSGGSGIIVGKNDDELLIATNNHVVAVSYTHLTGACSHRDLSVFITRIRCGRSVCCDSFSIILVFMNEEQNSRCYHTGLPAGRTV